MGSAPNTVRLRRATLDWARPVVRCRRLVPTVRLSLPAAGAFGQGPGGATASPPRPGPLRARPQPCKPGFGQGLEGAASSPRPGCMRLGEGCNARPQPCKPSCVRIRTTRVMRACVGTDVGVMGGRGGVCVCVGSLQVCVCGPHVMGEIIPGCSYRAFVRTPFSVIPFLGVFSEYLCSGLRTGFDVRLQVRSSMFAVLHVRESFVTGDCVRGSGQGLLSMAPCRSSFVQCS